MPLNSACRSEFVFTLPNEKLAVRITQPDPKQSHIGQHLASILKLGEVDRARLERTHQTVGTDAFCKCRGVKPYICADIPDTISSLHMLAELLVISRFIAAIGEEGRKQSIGANTASDISEQDHCAGGSPAHG